MQLKPGSWHLHGRAAGGCRDDIEMTTWADKTVDFLRAELDRVGPALADLCRDFFRRAVALELSFFEAAYADRT